ncbi:MAG TPA: hypothetical protein VGC73_03405 [Pyrinomonadaceae bacterium]
MLELALDGESDGVAGSDRDRLGVVIVTSANAVETESDGSLVSDEVGRNFEGLVARCRDLGESVGSAVVNHEKNDIGPIVVLDLEDHRTRDRDLGFGELWIVVEPMVSCAANHEQADSQAG